MMFAQIHNVELFFMYQTPALRAQQDLACAQSLAIDTEKVRIASVLFNRY